jgi:small multidrug resistance pump
MSTADLIDSSAALSIGYGSTDATFIDATRSLDEASSTFDESPSWKYWIILLTAILLEVAGTTSMKLSNGFTNRLPSILIYLFYGMSFAAFPLSLKKIQLSTAYAIWSGLGTTLTCIIGVVYFGDSVNWIKMWAIVSIVLGCVALKFADAIDCDGTKEMGVVHLK